MNYCLILLKQTLGDLMMLIYCRDCMCSSEQVAAPTNRSSSRTGSSSARKRRQPAATTRTRTNFAHQMHYAGQSRGAAFEAWPSGQPHEEIELNRFDCLLPHRAATASRAVFQQQQELAALKYRPTVIVSRRDVGTDTRSLIKYDLDPHSERLVERMSITEVPAAAAAEDVRPSDNENQIEADNEHEAEADDDDKLAIGNSVEMFGADELAEARLAPTESLTMVAAVLSGREERPPEPIRTEPKPNKKRHVLRLPRLARRKFDQLLHFSASASASASASTSSPPTRDHRPKNSAPPAPASASPQPADREETAVALLDRQTAAAAASTRCEPRPASIRRSALASRRMGDFMVMISYHHAEASGHALLLKAALERLGLSVYLDVHEIRKGSDWQDSLNEAILYCRAFVPLVTPSYGKTLWTSRELKLADVLHKLIIPVNFGQRWPPPSLAIQFATMQYIFWLATDYGSNPNAPPILRPFHGPDSGWPAECVRLVAAQIKQSVDYNFCPLDSSDHFQPNQVEQHHFGVLRIETKQLLLEQQQQQQPQPLTDSGYDSSFAGSIKHLLLEDKAATNDSSFEDFESLTNEPEEDDEEDDDHHHHKDGDEDNCSLDSSGPNSTRSSGCSCPNSNSSDDRLKFFRVPTATATATTPNSRKSTLTSPSAPPDLILTERQPAPPQTQAQRAPAREKKGLRNKAARALKKVRGFAFASAAANSRQQHSI